MIMGLCKDCYYEKYMDFRFSHGDKSVCEKCNKNDSLINPVGATERPVPDKEYLVIFVDGDEINTGVYFGTEKKLFYRTLMSNVTGPIKVDDYSFDEPHKIIGFTDNWKFGNLRTFVDITDERTRTQKIKRHAHSLVSIIESIMLFKEDMDLGGKK